MEQWQERLERFLIIDEVLPEIPKKRGRTKKRELIGRFGGGKDTRSGIVDIAVMQSMGKADEIREWIGEYGMVIVDECHHIPASTFEEVMKAVRAVYTYGLTATPKRADGHQPILNMYLGPVRYHVDARLQAMLSPFAHFMIPRFTGATYASGEGGQGSMSGLYRQIASDDLRNAMIVEDVLACVSEKRSCLVLSERTEHAAHLAELIGQQTGNVFVLTGSAKRAEKQRLFDAVRAVPESEHLVICATGRYIGEGFDESRLDSLFLAMPVSWEGTLAQYAGRLHRLCENKHEVRVYDYIDNNTEILSRMYNKRLKGYASIGYRTAEISAGGTEQNMIYRADNYEEAFLRDIGRVERSIIIAAPYAAASAVKQLLPLLSEAIRRRVEISVICGSADGLSESAKSAMAAAMEMLANTGVKIRTEERPYKKYAVIDGRTVWYGGINLLGGPNDESMLRIISSRIAGALLRDG